MGKICFVPSCKSGLKTCKDKVSLFKAPQDPTLLLKWKKSIRRADRELSQKDFVCEKHFVQSSIMRRWTVAHKGNVLMDCPKVARLHKDAIPTIFPGYPSYLSKPAITARKPPLSRKPPTPTATKRKNHAGRRNGKIVEVDGNEKSFEVDKINEIDEVDGLKVESVTSPTEELTFEKLEEAAAFNKIKLPNQSWAVHVIDGDENEREMVIGNVTPTKSGRHNMLTQICVDGSMNITIFCHDTKIDPERFGVMSTLQSLEELELLIHAVHDKQFCLIAPVTFNTKLRLKTVKYISFVA